MTIDKLIGNNLKRLRNDRGWTQKKVAKELGAKATSISSMELGKKAIGKKVLDRLCSVFQVHPYEFYREPVAEPPSQCPYEYEVPLLCKRYQSLSEHSKAELLKTLEYLTWKESGQ